MSTYYNFILQLEVQKVLPLRKTFIEYLYILSPEVVKKLNIYGYYTPYDILNNYG